QRIHHRRRRHDRRGGVRGRLGDELRLDAARRHRGQRHRSHLDHGEQGSRHARPCPAARRQLGRGPVSRSLRRWLGWLLLGAAAATWVLVLRPTSLGGPATYIVIRGDSMDPTYATGDLVILEQAASYGPGDIVAYRVPAGELGAGLAV